jgi:hypothetical protein
MAKRKNPKKKPATKKTASPKMGRSGAKPVKQRTATRKAKPARPRKSPSLGRPKVTADEKLYMLFKDDYQARQLFEFLRVESVGDLEQLSPTEIVARLSAPLRQTVERIRAILADKNRSLRDDQEFARSWQGRTGDTRES